MARHGFGRVATGACLLTLCGCEALGEFDRTGGNSQRGYFDVQPEARLARGATLDFTIEDHALFSSEGEVDLRQPESTSPQIASVERYEGSGTVTLLGRGLGHTDILFTAKSKGETLDDGFGVDVEEVSNLALDPCASDGVYLRGLPGRVSYQFLARSGHVLMGLGLYPVQWAPQSALGLEESTSTLTDFAFQVSPDAPEEVRLASTLTGDSGAVTLPIVDSSGLALFTAPGATQTEGASVVVDLRLAIGGRLVCSRLSKVVTSRTPKSCSLDGAVDGSVTTEEDALVMHLDATGTCRLAVELPELAMALDAAPITVTAKSSSSSTGDIDWDD